jgi:hypothetical protein
MNADVIIVFINALLWRVAAQYIMGEIDKTFKVLSFVSHTIM